MARRARLGAVTCRPAFHEAADHRSAKVSVTRRVLESFGMNKMDFITQRKQSFFQTEKEFCYCTGAKKIYGDDYREDGYGFIGWDAHVSEIPVEKVRLLMLLPSKPQLKKAALPDFIGKLSNLEHIVFDINFLKKEQVERLPPSVDSIILSRNLAYADLLKALTENKIEWNEDVRLENLGALLIIGDEEKTRITTRISAENLPSLKFLGFTFSSKDELETFRRFNALTDLELSNLRDLPIFEHIEHLPLLSLDITGANNKFDIAGAKRLKTLRHLRLNGVRSEVDCRLFAELPELTELVVLNSKKVLNVGALLDCKKLISISFLDCANPFKKEVARRFDQRAYEIFDIEYA